MINVFFDKFSNAFQANFPTKTLKNESCKDKVLNINWFKNNIKNMHETMKTLKIAVQFTSNENTRLHRNQFRSEYWAEISNAKIKTNSSLICSSENVSKARWQNITNNNNKKITSYEHVIDTITANDFNAYFTNNGKSITESLPLSITPTTFATSSLSPHLCHILL